MKTYISLFSSAGVGCYGFKMENFECIATNELIARRLNIQKINKKCKYDSGYICGDITLDSTKERLFNEIEMWKKNEKIKSVDCVIATPPCQGMSVANHKKSNVEIIRNSLVVESIKIIKEILPKVFIFENVPQFLKTICTDIDGLNKSIQEAINNSLSTNYNIIGKVLNFKNYGSNSSRSRTLVIGVKKEYEDIVSPNDLFPDYNDEKTLRQVIGNMKSLKDFYEFDPNDIYHFFRGYDSKMRSWVSNTPEGKSAFDNEKPEDRPHQIINGVYKENVRKNSDKYTRQCWDKVAPCIHTRNDQLASQNTIHPVDDRVFSIRELMKIMSVPDTFKWSDIPFDVLNSYSRDEKIKFLKKEEINIRQSLGEAVPTEVFRRIAEKINTFFKNNKKKIVKSIPKFTHNELINFIENNYDMIDLYSLMRIAEISNSNRVDNSAYYTDKCLLNEIENKLPTIEKEKIRILEPSVGVGNFIPMIIKKYESKKQITIDVIDIDKKSLEIFNLIIKKMRLPKNVIINYINDDFIKWNPVYKYDLAIGNPPFTKVSSKIFIDTKYTINRKSTNLASFFIEKCHQISDYVCMILPKNIINTPEFETTREYLSKYKINYLLDFGEKGFKGVLIETICIMISHDKPNNTSIVSIPFNKSLTQKQGYFTDKKMPYWILYRNTDFDNFYNNMQFNIFTVFRDRQVTNKLLHDSGDIRVYKSRNISDSGTKMINIDGYDQFISINDASKLQIYKFLNRDDVYLTPNMTYKTRVIRKEKNCIVNGSIAILIPREKIEISDEDLVFFSSEEYRSFMNIARNMQTRTLNVDATSVYFYGVRRK